MDGTAEVTWRGPIAILRPSRARLDRLAAWFQTEHDGLLRFAYLVCGDAQRAEDLLQDAFVAMYRAGARVDEDGIGAYARRTITNLARSHWRRSAREARALDGMTPAAAPPPDLETRDEIWRAMQDLSPRQRAVVALKFYEDRSERDIAAALGMSPGSVKKHADRALEKLRARLGGRSDA